jgi:hypothetical protein
MAWRSLWSVADVLRGHSETPGLEMLPTGSAPDWAGLLP